MSVNLKPSGADRWAFCPAAPRLEAQFPRTWGESVKRGLAAHKLAELALNGQAAPSRWAGEKLEGVEIDAEIVNAVSVYLASARDNAALYPGAMIRPEVPIAIPDLGLNGKIDLVVFDTGNPEAPPFVYDFKFGREYVDAGDNMQGAIYMLGLCQFFPMAPGFNFIIAQPRNYSAEGPVRSCYYTKAEILTTGEHLIRAAAEARGENPTAKAGPHCKYCQARHACPAMGQAAHYWSGWADSATPETAGADVIGLELDMLSEALDTLRARQTALVAEAEARIRKGETVPGYRLAESFGHLQWAIDAQDVEALGLLYGVDLFKPREFITPTQAIAAGLDEEAVKGFAIRDKKGVRLEKADLKKERRIFA